MVHVSIYASKGIHDSNWKNFQVKVYKNATMIDVISKLSTYFVSGYH